jgi:hypothetical protein
VQGRQRQIPPPTSSVTPPCKCGCVCARVGCQRPDAYTICIHICIHIVDKTHNAYITCIQKRRQNTHRDTEHRARRRGSRHRARTVPERKLLVQRCQTFSKLSAFVYVHDTADFLRIFA